MICRCDHNKLIITQDKNGIVFKIDPNKSLEKIISEQSEKYPYIAQLNIYPFNQNNHNGKKLLYSQVNNKSIFTAHLDYDLDIKPCFKLSLRNKHLLKNIEIEHILNPEKLEERHLLKIAQYADNAYKSRKIAEQALREYVRIIHAWT